MLLKSRDGCDDWHSTAEYTWNQNAIFCDRARWYIDFRLRCSSVPPVSGLAAVCPPFVASIILHGYIQACPLQVRMFNGGT